MKKALYLVALLFCLFPYTQIIPLESYTQPYALAFSLMAAIVAVPLVQNHFPTRPLLVLCALAISGLTSFIITCLPNPDPQELKYLLIYLSPIVFAIATFGVTVEATEMADRVIVGSTIAWIAVGSIQAIIDPNFMTGLVGNYGSDVEVVLESGRGVLSLAPEPTHFGFHMIILATLLALVGGRNALSLICLATAVFIARSSSAVLALGLAAIVYIVIYGRLARMLLIAVLPAYFLLGLILTSGLLSSDIRLVALLHNFYQDPFYGITTDASANMRLGGIYVGFQEIARSLLMPMGLASETWEMAIGPALARNPWLMFLSSAGVPSGILIVVYQLGFIGLLIMAYLIQLLAREGQSHYETFLLFSIPFVFLAQNMIATPGFGVIIGVLMARRAINSSQQRPQGAASPMDTRVDFVRSSQN